jgi:23S rRNA pseudouridine2605 synthase
VTVNGKIELIPQTLVDLEKDRVLFNGKRIVKEMKVYYALHKPKGYICTNANNGSSRRAIDLIDSEERLYTIGRLDKETSGLIILTNDGHFANMIMHPRSQVQKEYLVKVDKEVLHEHLVTIAKGCYIERKRVVPESVTKVRRGTLKIVVHDGRKHEVRILCQRADLEVVELTRIRIGPLVLSKLPLGAYRPLSPKEIEQLKASVHVPETE